MRRAARAARAHAPANRVAAGRHPSCRQHAAAGLGRHGLTCLVARWWRMAYCRAGRGADHAQGSFKAMVTA